MSMFLVTSGRDEFGPTTMTVNADKFETDEQFVVFKTGNVVVKAIRNWMVDSVELIDPPASTKD